MQLSTRENTVYDTELNVDMDSKSFILIHTHFHVLHNSFE